MENSPRFCSDETSMRIFTKFKAEDQQKIMNLPEEKRIEAILALYIIRFKEAIDSANEIATSTSQPQPVTSTIPFELETGDPSDFDIMEQAEI